MSERRASCSCGKLSAVAGGEPIRISICHCHACQRRTGSVFGAQARFQKAEVTIEGESTVYLRTGDSGGKISFHFCPTCGSTVYYVIDQMADTIAIPVGAFADQSFPAPKVSVYEARRHMWAGIPADVEHYD